MDFYLISLLRKNYRASNNVNLFILSPKRNGFTLIEILVALTIVAVALTTLIASIANHVFQTSNLKNKTLAHWVALNKINEIKLSNKWPNPGVKKGTYLMAEHEWEWTTTTRETEDKNVRRMDIEVRLEKFSEDPEIKLITYIAQK